MAPQKIMSDAGSHFVFENFQKFYRRMKIHHTIPSSYKHQSNGQVEMCRKLHKVDYEVSTLLLIERLI